MTCQTALKSSVEKCPDFYIRPQQIQFKATTPLQNLAKRCYMTNCPLVLTETL